MQVNKGQSEQLKVCVPEIQVVCRAQLGTGGLVPAEKTGNIVKQASWNSCRGQGHREQLPFQCVSCLLTWI